MKEFVLVLDTINLFLLIFGGNLFYLVRIANLFLLVEGITSYFRDYYSSVFFISDLVKISNLLFFIWRDFSLFCPKLLTFSAYLEGLSLILVRITFLLIWKDPFLFWTQSLPYSFYLIEFLLTLDTITPLLLGLDIFLLIWSELLNFSSYFRCNYSFPYLKVFLLIYLCQ